MLANQNEYRMMFEAEEKLWWYKILHEKAYSQIVEVFGDNKNLKILDAGCGTGGMMVFLLNKGYQNIEGFDYSIDAVNFCKERNLSVQQIDISDFENRFANLTFDVIINNDVVYQFEDASIRGIYKTFQQILKTDGLLITNNNAFNVFYGTHDIAVGGKQRFKLANFQQITNGFSFEIIYHSYWSWVLAPLILIVRLFQQFQIKLKLIDLKNIKSDVSVPSSFINNLLYRIVKFEEKFFTKGFFGSSLFIVYRKTATSSKRGSN